VFNVDHKDTKSFFTGLQVRRGKDRKQGAFHLHEALFEVLVDNKLEFVQLFLERVDLNEFFKDYQLDDLYREVPGSCFCSFLSCVMHSSFYFSLAFDRFIFLCSFIYHDNVLPYALTIVGALQSSTPI